MRVHLVDGTYELFRHYYGPAGKRPDPTESQAIKGVLGTVVGMLQDGAPTSALPPTTSSSRSATDMWRLYKSIAGMPPDLLAQFPPLEDALERSA